MGLGIIGAEDLIEGMGWRYCKGELYALPEGRSCFWFFD